ESFNLNRAESVRFIQPNASSSVLNRIMNGMPTGIDGSVYANGNVYFVNPAGIYFGRNAVINVGGIFAAAGNISNQDFLNNVNRFTDLSGEVINRGQINAVSGAHLVGRRVANFGQIVAPDGMITMTAGKDVLLGERGGKVFARIKGDAANPGSVENHGVIDAGSGQVLAGVGDHFALALYDTSRIRATSIRVAGGASSSVRVSGELDASNAAGAGGQIDVLGGKIALRNAELDASGTTAGGQIHVGGDFQGKGDRLRARATLVDANSTINVDASNGDAGSAVVWSDGATFFYGDISARGAGKGGFAEVSSKGMLDFRGSFDLRGAFRNGTLLLDPKNIQVVANGTGPAATEADFDEFSDNASGSSLLDADLLSGWLNGPGAEVILQASNDIFFLNGANVVQNAGSNVDLRLTAGRRIMFLGGSVLSLDGGSLFATANAQGFVAGQRDAGFGSILVLDGAVVRSNTGALNFTVDSTADATSTPGDLVLFGDVRAPVLNLAATYTNSRIGLVEDGDAGNDTIGFGGRVSIDAGQFVVFLNHAGEWSFESLDVASPLIVFDANATGVTATGIDPSDGLTFTQLDRLGPVGLFTQNT
ncbi:MAG TPA: filamentous hemagglutinin N-terminal domain-containing protein, partial [Phycisphaerales bacterium]|nr:filamentous hemagglutinin N-terminal domain-containing protein [Phycisphaerales bacterium]